MKDYIIRKIKTKRKNKYTYNYFDKRKNKINSKKTINNYLKGVYIPPAYDNVKINKNKNSKILSIGYDNKNRPQYTYNKNFINKNSKSKYKKLISFGNNYKKITKKINNDLNGSDIKNKLIALALRLIIYCNFRIGNEKYTQDNKSYGVTTLEKKHIKINNNNLLIEFIGKKSVKNTCIVKDKKIINLLKYLYKNNNSNKIFTYVNDNNKTVSITSNDVNNYLKLLGNYTTKNFRTWNANIELIKNILKNSSKDLKYNIDMVSNSLHHTSAICKKNYLDPKLIKFYNKDKSKFIKFFKNGNRVYKNYVKFLSENY